MKVYLETCPICGLCSRVLESVATGSDAHVGLAAEYLVRSLRKWGPGHEESKQASAGAARYGRGGMSISYTMCLLAP